MAYKTLLDSSFLYCSVGLAGSERLLGQSLPTPLSYLPQQRLWVVADANSVMFPLPGDFAPPNVFAAYKIPGMVRVFVVL